MAVASSALPQWMLLDGRWAYATQYDGNNNLVLWPASGASNAGSQWMTGGGQWGWASAAHTITKGPDTQITGDPVWVDYQGILWGIAFNTSTTIPNFLFSILTASWSNVAGRYTVT